MREKTRKEKRKEILQAIDRNSLNMECSTTNRSNRKIQNSFHHYGSLTFCSRIPNILKDEGYSNAFCCDNTTTVTSSSFKYNNDVSNFGVTQMDQECKIVDEVNTIPNSNRRKEIIYNNNTLDNQTIIEQRSINDDDIVEDEVDHGLFHFLLQYSENFQWEDDNNKWYDPIPMK